MHRHCMRGIDSTWASMCRRGGVPHSRGPMLTASQLPASLGFLSAHSVWTAQARADLREFVGYSRADELEKLEKLKASGAISADEFAKLRAQAIG